MNDYRGKHISSAPWVSSAPSYRGRHRIRNRKHRKWYILVLVLVLLMLAWPLIEARLLTTERVQLKADQLPAEANNLKIVYLSDIHYGFWFSDADLNRLVARINGLRPDLVLFGGDYATDHQTAVEFFKKLRNGEKIRSRYGTYGVVGETDRGESNFDLEELTETMANADVEPLVNRAVPVHIGAAKIYIAGLDDVIAGKPDLKAVSRSVSASDYVILMSHNPSVIRQPRVVRPWLIRPYARRTDAVLFLFPGDIRRYPGALQGRVAEGKPRGPAGIARGRNKRFPGQTVLFPADSLY